VRAVFADCHVGRSPNDDGPFLLALDEAVRRGARSITLLGDIFHFFIAHPKFETPPIRRLLQTAEKLARQGVSVSYVEGNRDFFLRGSYAERYFQKVVDEEAFVEGGRRFLATHGDLLNERDIPYRFWRALSKNPVSRLLLDVVPKDFGNRLVWKTEARLYKSNFKHKTKLPVEMIRRFAEKRFHEGHHVLLLGHFHKPWSEQLGSGRVEILPAFVESQQWMEVDDRGETKLVGLSE
jgi:UDP-2,3-diacylglucosamine hydrolase